MGEESFSLVRSPAKTNCIPRAKGFHWLSILGDWEVRGVELGRSLARRWPGVRTAPEAGTALARSSREAIRIVNTAGRTRPLGIEPLSQRSYITSPGAEMTRSPFPDFRVRDPANKADADMSAFDRWCTDSIYR
jgi:hypothetical protein